MYDPDFWCVIKINSADPHYRVFGSWASSYATGSSWRMNSGITKVEEKDDCFLFHGSTGSIYRCHKEMYGCHYGSQAQLNHFMNQPEVAVVDLLSEETNWLEMDWIINA